MNNPPLVIAAEVHRPLMLVLLTIGLGAVGCNSPTPAPPPAPASKPAASPTVARAEAPLRVFTGEDEVAPVSYLFEGGSGSVRVTMEVEGTSSANPPRPPTVNDVSFKAEGPGRISVAFKRPWPGHDNGRVTIACTSGEETSTAEFEPELWFGHRGAIITLESPVAEPASAVVEGKEVVLARYVARNIPRDIRLTFKAVFTREPLAPRTKAGMKSPGPR